MRILVIPGDSRMKYAAAALNADLFPDAAGKYDVIVLPMPLKTMIPDIDAVRTFAGDNAVVFAGGKTELEGFSVVNYAEIEPLILKNALLTAQAAACVLSESTDRALLGQQVLITGYGRIAAFLSRILAAFGANVTIAARRAEVRIKAEMDGFSAIAVDEIPEKTADFSYIVNTVPTPIFGDTSEKMSGVFLELATLPPSPPSNPRVKYIHGGGLPGKHFPETAGEIIAETVRKEIRYEQRFG